MTWSAFSPGAATECKYPPVSRSRLEEERELGQPEWNGVSVVARAAVSVNEDWPRSSEGLVAAIRLICQEQTLLRTDVEQGKTGSARAGPGGDLAVNGVPMAW
jgi:hypothetical protein